MARLDKSLATGKGPAEHRTRLDSVRKTPTERLYDALMASLERKPSPPESSVTITRNAKGDAQFEVVVRGPDVHACHTEAEAIYAKLRLSYPHSAEVAA